MSDRWLYELTCIRIVFAHEQKHKRLELQYGWKGNKFILRLIYFHYYFSVTTKCRSFENSILRNFTFYVICTINFNIYGYRTYKINSKRKVSSFNWPIFRLRFFYFYYLNSPLCVVSIL